MKLRWYPSVLTESCMMGYMFWESQREKGKERKDCVKE